MRAMPADGLPRYAIRGAEVLVRAGCDFLAHTVRGPQADGGWTALSAEGACLSAASDTWPLPAYAGATDRGLGGVAYRFEPDAPAPDGWEWRPLRSAITALPASAWAGAARAMAFMNWRAATRFCGRCGAPNRDKEDELARQCVSCGSLSFPRISPAVLAVIRKGDRLLLARNAGNKQGIWSLIAGFVEPGETFEDCVRREVLEEVGIRVSVDRYEGSQPWPFPDQLMLGFSGSWLSGELRPDGVEIAEAGWFGPDGHPPIPGGGSLSRKLIDEAFDGIRRAQDPLTRA